jgi:hypothetical protein
MIVHIVFDRTEIFKGVIHLPDNARGKKEGIPE